MFLRNVELSKNLWYYIQCYKNKYNKKWGIKYE